jgi:hypothetical protein
MVPQQVNVEENKNDIQQCLSENYGSLEEEF